MIPLVSIVIAHLNRADLLAQSVQSIEGQEYDNWEVIVVDDQSEPEQWAAIGAFAGQKIQVLQRADGLRGPSRCRNLGAAAAKGDYLVFLDSDDLLAPWCLKQRVQRALFSPEQDFWVFPVLLFHDRPGDMHLWWNDMAGDDDLRRFLRSDPPWHTSSPLWSRDSFLEAGGFNEQVLYGDDADLHIRVLLRGQDFEKYPDLLPDVFVRRGDHPRITSMLTPAIVESRLVRLLEGARMLRRLGASDSCLDAWEGQYFCECEELLFHQEHPQQAIDSVLRAWKSEYQPTWFRWFLVAQYFRIAIACRTRAYLIFRIVRRMARIAMPAEYFPHELSQSDPTCPDAVVDNVRRLLCGNVNSEVRSV